MAKPEYLSLSKRIIDRLSVDDKDTVFWDRDLPGFGIRVYPSGAKVYVVQTRVFGRSKRFTVGRHGRLSADQARRKATRIIARIKAGEPDPLEEPAAAPTVADLAERYQREYVAMHCKPLTLSHYGLMLRKHIVPALGKLLVSEVERKHIMALQYSLRDTPAVQTTRWTSLSRCLVWPMRGDGVRQATTPAGSSTATSWRNTTSGS